MKNYIIKTIKLYEDSWATQQLRQETHNEYITVLNVTCSSLYTLHNRVISSTTSDEYIKKPQHGATYFYAFFLQL